LVVRRTKGEYATLAFMFPRPVKEVLDADDLEELRRKLSLMSIPQARSLLPVNLLGVPPSGWEGSPASRHPEASAGVEAVEEVIGL
jgi:hypothetical protein